jgi:hypothetical protein
LREALDAIPADEPRSYLRQSLQLLVPLLEQIHQRLQALDARLRSLLPAPMCPRLHALEGSAHAHVE